MYMSSSLASENLLVMFAFNEILSHRSVKIISLMSTKELTLKLGVGLYLKIRGNSIMPMKYIV